MKILFIGAGNMAKAIIFAMIDKMHYNPKQIIVFDKIEEQYEDFVKKNVIAAKNIAEAVEVSDVIIFSVKPQNMEEALTWVKNTRLELSEKLYVSICASVTTAFIKKKLALNVPIIRIMPNTALMVGKGMSAICKNEFVTAQEFEFVCKIFQSLGEIAIMEESRMNNIIPVNASSPAMIYKMIASMTDAAKILGFEENESYMMVKQVFAGAVQMLEESGKKPDELIKMVASKKGTTEKALEVLDANNFTNAIIQAMLECASRADELTQEICGLD